ncbi:MAG: replication-associated recombination protein A [Clostridia bacterium]|nr:replication-associated recombination protein A [Clostridia bacterium]
MANKNEVLADILRPQSFDDIVGQAHLFGERGILRRMMEKGRMSNMIFFGPPGTGKTTAASIIAKQSGMNFYKLNATSASLSDVKDIIAQTNNVFGFGGILLYIDEIQYFNRKQQQALLEYMEDGRITLIASTTENPHFYIYNAIISRSTLFEFKPVEKKELAIALKRALDFLNERDGTSVIVSEKTLEFIAQCSGGDVRHAINLLEGAYYACEGMINEELVRELHIPVDNFSDDAHFDLLSCLQKSIRGSDPDAAVFYLAKLLHCGELLSVCRRLQVIASEDIGLAYPQAAAIVKACCDSARELGMPEAAIPLSNAAVLLATSPKSNTAHDAYFAAKADVEAGLGKDIPVHLRSPLFKGYKYPHSYENRYVKQQYLPDDIKHKKYYEYGENKNERAAKEYWDKIKK